MPKSNNKNRFLKKGELKNQIEDDDEVLEQTTKEDGKNFIKIDGGEKEKKKEVKEQESRVIYVGHIPHGFYEEQLKGFFSQFGDIEKVRISRNPKTGHSRHYAFIRFQSSDVAKIAAETMDNYLLIGRKLVCKVMPMEEISKELFAKSSKGLLHPAKLYRKQIQKVNRKRTLSEIKVLAQRKKKKDEQRAKKLKELGIDYELPNNTNKPTTTKPKKNKQKSKEATPAKPSTTTSKASTPEITTTTKQSKSTTSTPKSATPAKSPAAATPKAATPKSATPAKSPATVTAKSPATVTATTPMKSANTPSKPSSRKNTPKK